MNNLAQALQFLVVFMWGRKLPEQVPECKKTKKEEEGRKDLERSLERKSNGRKRNFKSPTFLHFHSAADRNRTEWMNPFADSN